MPVSQQSYPDWVRAFRTRGTVVKKVNERYYLYKRTSKRIPGKKYPQPVDTYIGLITENGVVKADKNLIPVNEPCIVKEYGFSRALLLRCPDNWKKAAGDERSGSAVRSAGARIGRSTERSRKRIPRRSTPRCARIAGRPSRSTAIRTGSTAVMSITWRTTLAADETVFIRKKRAEMT